MIRRGIVYGMAVTVTLYLFFMYDTSVLSGILILELLYPMVSGVFLILAGKKISASLKTSILIGEEGGKIPIELICTNNSFLWSIKYKLCIVATHNYRGTTKRMFISGCAEPGIAYEVYRDIESPYCGTLTVRIKEIKVYDFLGIFFAKRKVSKEISMGIMPKFQLLPMEITRRTREFPADAQEYSTQKRGNDPTEIYQVREYRPGDPVHDIHWKLTAKEDELMIKERALPLGCAVLLWIDFKAATAKGRGLEQIIQMAACLSFTLMAQKCIHMASWFVPESNRIIKWRVDDEESLYEFVWMLLSLEPYIDEALCETCYEEAFRGEYFSSVVKIEVGGKISVNGVEQTLLQV